MSTQSGSKGAYKITGFVVLALVLIGAGQGGWSMMDDTGHSMFYLAGAVALFLLYYGYSNEH